MAAPGSRSRRRQTTRGAVGSTGVGGVLVVAFLLGGLSFLYIHQGTLLRHLTAEREIAQEDLTELEEINHTLRLQIEEAFSLPRISRYAVDRLGMIEPPVTRYVRIPPNVQP